MRIMSPARLRPALSARLALEAGRGTLYRERAMAKIEISRGMRFGWLTVIEESDTRVLPCGQSRRMVLCQCDCGRTTIAELSKLRSHGTKSCGCARFDGSHSVIHGMSHSTTWVSWRAMKQRCEDRTHKYFSLYGGNEITICERWSASFEAFLEDMGERPNGLTLDRIDNSKGYSKDNCRWATRKEQARNRRGNKLIEFRGETRCVAEWAEIVRIHYDIINSRLHNGWTVEKALTKRPKVQKNSRNGGSQ